MTTITKARATLAEQHMPIRIQRKRTKGWRIPENTVSVCRPGFWGNNYKVGETVQKERGTGYDVFVVRDAAHATQLYRDFIVPVVENGSWIIEELRGKNLACWCPLDQPCHADVLLELANK